VENLAEHRIPYNGVAGFPTNVTLTRFLELHIEITGDLPDPTSGTTDTHTATAR
jgi:tripartite motif-containing protein 71